MDWQRSSTEWADLDFAKFEYESRNTTVLTKLATHKVNILAPRYYDDQVLANYHGRMRCWTS